MAKLNEQKSSLLIALENAADCEQTPEEAHAELAAEGVDVKAFLTRIKSEAVTPSNFEEHALDLAVECPARGCLATVGDACSGLPSRICHFARRLKRLISEGKHA